MDCGGAGEMDGGDGIVSTEDAVAALLDHFVEPLLHGRDANNDPSPLPVAQQEEVAKQVHKVVILYNYYHRERFQQLRFLDFARFCKVATIAKPTLLRYLENFAKGDDGHVSAHQLSITEKAIKNACNICAALDASKGIVNMEGWSASKVAVFLVDTTMTKCLLELSSVTIGACVTKGAWSLVENAIDTSVTPDANEDIFRELAFSMVENETGIDQKNLSILGRHLTYSLTEENGVRFLYVMTYSANKDISHCKEIPVVDVISSLTGPILKNLEYYHLLPYVENIMKYLIKKAADTSSLECNKPSEEENLVLPKVDVKDSPVMPSSKWQDAFSALQDVNRRRNELCDQLRALDDDISQREMSIEKILSVGREEMQSSFGPAFGRKSLAKAFKNFGSFCQELDDLSRENNWLLPRYSRTVLPKANDGTQEFQANVFVEGTDFKLTVNGDRRSSPHESRQSAAGLALIKLRHMAAVAAASQAAPAPQLMNPLLLA